MALIRTEIKDDFKGIHAVHQEAFKRTAEGDLVNTLRHSSCFTNELSLVAIQNDVVVGHILFTRVAIKDGNRTYPALALAPLGVDPDFQKQGIGSMLVKEGLYRAKYLGHKVVFVLGDPSYYSRFGFEFADHYGITPPSGLPSDKFLLTKLTDDAFVTKGQVFYPLAFNRV